MSSSVIFLALCFFGMMSAWRVGAGSLLAEHAKRALLLEQADRAVEQSPADPETRTARALVLYNRNDARRALEEFEAAVSLRPRDYLLRLQLGRALDETGDTGGALVALRESLNLAPHYSEPRWQYGNVLYRLARFEEAFSEMRRAVESDPARLPVFIDLAWGTYKGDAVAVERAVLPRTDEQRYRLARFFARNERPAEALALLRASSEISGEDRRALVVEMLKAGQFTAAYEIWADGRALACDARPSGVATVTDAGFEGRINLHDAGYGWRQERKLDGISLALDTKIKRSGGHALSIEWSGHADPTAQVISQLILVEPQSRYALSFHARTEGIVTGGLPLISISDPGDGRVLAQSEPLSQAATEWREYEVSFATAVTTQAVLISVTRRTCRTSPCPMFGQVWLDDFSLRKN